MNEAATPDNVMRLPQGDVRLLESEVAQGLLASRELARIAYVAADGTPRVDPMLFVWTGSELVVSTFDGSYKIRSLRARPDVTVLIDTAGPPPHVLHLRGRAVVTDVDGIVPEYLQAHLRYGGEAQAAAAKAEIDRPGLRMARIAVRPTWVGLADFQTRFPGGLTAEDFAQRGRKA